jgi:hypothetical protein
VKRRAFVAAVGGASLLGAGCLGRSGADPTPEVDVIEVENHRREEGSEFSVRVTDGEETLFEEVGSLGPAGSGESAVAFADPVADPGAYEVVVEVGDEAANVETAEWVSGDETCLRLVFYLGPRSLHWEHTSYQRCA